MALLILPFVLVAVAFAVAMGFATMSLWIILLVCCSLSVTVIEMVAAWTVFSKAGQPGWAAFVPIYNFVILCRIGGHSGWWVLLLLIPLVHFVIPFIVHIDVARKFGHSALFGVCFTLFDFIGMPVLAFSDARYDPRA